jgi:DNA-binding NarL/FixJ family response regulator
MAAETIGSLPGRNGTVAMRCGPAPGRTDRRRLHAFARSGRASKETVSERTGPAPERTPASVLVAEPEMLVRAGLRTVIDADSAFHVAAEAESGEHALELIARLRPALAIVSTGLHEPGGLEVARRAHALSPSTAIVLLARAEDTHSLIEGFRAGVTGFVRSDVGRLELLSSLGRALAGESVIDPAAATQLIVRMAAESEPMPHAMPDPLTPRELEILQLVAQGQTNRQIAMRLIVAVGTIKIHIEHILGKLGAADRTQAAVIAAELGMVHADEQERRVAPHA